MGLIEDLKNKLGNKDYSQKDKGTDIEINIDDFQKNIRSEIEDLDKEQTVFFAWLCGVRALPFLGYRGNFDFWVEEKKQKHLYSVFQALDISISVVTETGNVDYYTDYAIVDAIADADNTYHDAADATTAAAYAVKIDITEYKSIILKDIEQIGENNYEEFDNDLSIYGDIWDNFQKALKDNGCEYWGKLYERIFKKGFNIDEEEKKELNKRLNVLDEIKEQGAKAVAEELIAMKEKGSEFLDEARIIILGEKGAGKTCLARRLIDPYAKMTKPHESTDGVVRTIWNVNEEQKKVKVHIWDFAGHVITHMMHRYFMSARCLYIIVYNGRAENRDQLIYWLNYIKTFGKNSDTIILTNVWDKNDQPEIQKNNIKNKYTFIRYFKELSIDDSGCMQTFKNDVSNYIIENYYNKQAMRKDQFELKNAVEKYYESKQHNDTTTKSYFDELIKKFEIHEDKPNETLKALHDLGVCLWYGDIYDNESNELGDSHLILNPEWLSDGIYQLIRWANLERRSKLSIEKVCNALSDIYGEKKERYTQHNIKFIFALLKKYDLAFSDADKNEILIPFLLPSDQPKNFDSTDWFQAGDKEIIEFYLTIESKLPVFTVSHLIVKRNNQNDEVS